MKKLILILFALSLFTACENEPLDSGLLEQGGGDDGGGDDGGDPSGGTYALSNYAYDKTIDTGAGDSVIDTDFVVNSSGQISSQNTSFEIFGIIVNGIAPVTRDSDGRIIETSVTDGTNELNSTTISYNGDDIVQISYVDNQSPEENYTYNIEHNGNVATRTEVGSTIIVIYTFDSDDRIIQREMLSNTSPLRLETLSYDTNGNLTSAVLTGDGARTFTYTYDNNTNPLKPLFQDFYKMQLFNDNYDDQMEHWLAFWSGTNNMMSATTPEGPSDLELVYDADDRIITRSGSINSALLNAGSGAITVDEVFTYVN